MARSFKKFKKFKGFQGRRYDMRKGVILIPNIITTASLFCAFFSIIQTLNGNYHVAAWIIFIAGLFDMVDGRIARMAKASSDFGVEYDSLCDLASFGLAPVVLIYAWALHDFSRVGIAAAFLFFACGAMRLARFNVQAGNVERKQFQGLPIPMAAGPLITYVIFYQNLYGDVSPAKSWLLLAITISCALLMVSNVSYQSFKHFSSRAKASFFYLVGSAVVIFFFIIAPHEFVFVTSLVYASSGLVEWIIRKLFRLQPATQLQTANLGGSTTNTINE